MKLRITIWIIFTVGPVSLALSISHYGKAKIYAIFSNGFMSQGVSECIRKCSPTEAGLDSFRTINVLAGTPGVLSVTTNSKGQVESNAGVGATVPLTSNVSVRIAAVTPVFSSLQTGNQTESSNLDLLSTQCFPRNSARCQIRESIESRRKDYGKALYIAPR